MTSTEKTNLKNSLTRLAAAFATSNVIQQYITGWKNDVDAVANGTPGVSDNTANISEEGILICTVATLPSSPATNDDAIVTDAKNVTPGATVAGGGAQTVYVKYNGSAWTIRPLTYTVATLPSSPSTNDEAVVTDAANVTPGATVVGGGTIRALVRYTGSAWKVVPLAFTVATLPATPATNDEAVVTDSTTATNGGTVVGGGSTRVLVRYDGANWKIV